MGSLVPFSPLAARARLRLAKSSRCPSARAGGARSGRRRPTRGGPVVVLMAVSDRTRFLDAQVASILDQTWPAVRLVIRDHGAMGETRRALDRWRGDPNVLLLRAGGPRTATSVLDLLGLVGEGEIVALADEDALWHPNKVTRAVSSLDDAPNNIPALYCARAFEVGGAATEMTPAWAGRPGFGNALVENIALGSTVVLNADAAARLRQAGTPAGAISPGWWSYLVTSAFGVVAFDDWASVLLGAPADATFKTAALPDIVAQARSFLAHYGEAPSLREAHRRLASGFARGSDIERRALAFDTRVYRQSALDDARLRVRMLMGSWPAMDEPKPGPGSVSARAA